MYEENMLSLPLDTFLYWKKKKQAVDVGGFSRWSGLQLSVVSSLVSGDKYFDSAMPCCLFFLKVRKTRTYDREIN